MKSFTIIMVVLALSLAACKAQKKSTPNYSKETAKIKTA
jgi:hypothetical protein